MNDLLEKIVSEPYAYFCVKAAVYLWCCVLLIELGENVGKFIFSITN